MIAVSDYYQFDDLLTDEEKALRKKVRGIMEKEIAPIMTEVRFRFLVKHVLCAESCGGLVDTMLLLYHDILISLGLTC